MCYLPIIIGFIKIFEKNHSMILGSQASSWLEACPLL